MNDSNKNYLEKLGKEEMNKQIFKSKIKWAEEAQINSKYLLSLQKRNYTKKSILSLEINDNIIKDQTEISEALNQFYEILYAEKLNQNDPNYQDSLDDFLMNNNMSTFGKHAFTKKCVRFDIPKIVNNCSNSILDKINTHSLQGFSGYIKTNYVECYKENCNIMDCYVSKN